MLNRLTALMEISLGCSAVIVLLFLLTPILSKRFSPRLRYWAWALLAVRLLLPGMPLELNVVPAPIQIETPQVITAPAYDGMAQDIKEALPYGYMADVYGNTPYHVWYSDDQDNSIRTYDNPIFRLESYNNDWSVSFHWEGVWKLGLILCLGWQLISHLAFVRRIRRWSVPTSPEYLAALDAQQLAVGTFRRVSLVQCELVSSPLLMGFIKPTIVLPAQLPEHTLAPSLAHELTHLKRGDLWYQLLLLLARCVHWFNPLVWLMVRQAKRDMELCCDYDLLHSQSEETRRAYGQAILDQMTAGRGVSPLTTGFSGDKKSIFTRFKAIMDTSPKKKGTAVLVLILCAAALAGTLISCNTAKEGSPVTASLKEQPEQSVTALYCPNGFQGDHTSLPTLVTYSTQDTLVIQLPEGMNTSSASAAVSYYRGGTVHSEFHTLSSDRFGQAVLPINLDGWNFSVVSLTCQEGSQAQYAFRVTFPYVTASLESDPAQQITANYYAQGFDWDYDILPTLSTYANNEILTVTLPEGVSGPVYLSTDTHHSPDKNGHAKIDKETVPIVLPEGEYSFSVSLLGLQTGTLKKQVFFLTWGEGSHFRHVFRIEPLPLPELTLTDAFSRYPSDSFSVSSTEYDGLPYYKFENAPSAVTVLMPEQCQTDPSIISYRGRTMTAILPCNPLSGCKYGNAGGQASFTVVDLTGDGNDELVYIWGYGGTGVWEDQCKIFDLTTMEELPVSMQDNELLSHYIQAELVAYDSQVVNGTDWEHSGIFRLTTRDGSSFYTSTAAQNTAQQPGPTELRFDGHTHLAVEKNQLKFCLAFSPGNTDTFMPTLSYLGEITGTMTYSPSLRAFTMSPPFAVDVFSPMEHQP